MKALFTYLALMLAFSLGIAGIQLYRDAQWRNRRSQEASLQQAAIPSIPTDSIHDPFPPPAHFLQKIDLNAPTERLAAIQQCGSCHPRQYQNELDGPHAAAYRKLNESYATIQNSGLYPQPYADWLKLNMDKCFSCHVSENIYETRLQNTQSIDGLHELAKGHFPDLTRMAAPRQDPATWATGIDCITCHYDGKRVLTGPDFKADPAKTSMPGYCDPLPSRFFSTNMGCVSCHRIQVDHVTSYASLGVNTRLESAETNCIRCHQEYDKQGKGTHYYFWRHDDPEKHPRKRVKGGIFDALKLDVQVKSGQAKLVLDWENKLYPHNFSECGEVVAIVKVYDASADSVFAMDVRLNRKADHDVHLREQMGGADPPGKMGYPFLPSMDALHEEYFLPDGFDYSRGHLHIVGIDKGQYWADDAIGEVVYDVFQQF